MQGKTHKKSGEYNYQVAIISSPVYKELAKRYNSVKEEYSREKQRRLEELQAREEQLNKCRAQKQRIDAERIKIIQRRDELRQRIQEIRERNEMLRNQHMQRREEYRIMNMEYLRNMVIGMKYQNGLDVDVDNMTYEELLELEEKMGSVSKGLTEEQIQKLPKKVYQLDQPQELCSVCYYNAKENEEMTILPCKHTFHSECIKEWLCKEKMCPMCKQEIITKIQSSSKVLIQQSQSSESQIQSAQSIYKQDSQSQSQQNLSVNKIQQQNGSQQLVQLSNHA